MNKEWLSYVLLALLLLFTGSIALQGNPLSKSLSATLVADDGKAERPIDTHELAASVQERTDSVRAMDALMSTILANPRRVPALPPEKIDTETLWLARCIYSETKRPEEMELVAWVVRNRVETRYRGKNSYRDVVLDPYQFSAFNPESRKRRFYASLTPDTHSPEWQRALTIAYGVRGAPASKRPFPKTTRHFYSERSMVGRSHPEWSTGLQPIDPQRSFSLDERRFRFFAGVY